MKNTAIVYHRIDFDGIASYAIARLALEKGDTQIKAVPYNYGDAIPDLSSYDEVYIVDCTMPAEIMRKLHEKGVLTWIDHHATSIKDSKEHGYEDCRGFRMVGVAACELCWMFFHENEKLPILVSYLAAYDIYDITKENWESEILPFQYGMRNRYGHDAEKFFDFFKPCLMESKTEEEYYANLYAMQEIEECVRDGKVILSYIRNSGKVAATFGFDAVINGTNESGEREEYHALMMLTPFSGSLPYAETAVKKGLPIVACVAPVEGHKYKLSLYSASGDAPTDLGRLMRERFGGGGHYNAAGATLDEKEFFSLMWTHIL